MAVASMTADATAIGPAHLLPKLAMVRSAPPPPATESMLRRLVNRLEPGSIITLIPRASGTALGIPPAADAIRAYLAPDESPATLRGSIP